MKKIPLQTWLALFVLGAGGLLTAVMALFAFMTMTATPIHPDAADVPSSATPPAEAWRDAIARGHDLMQAGLVEQNLPGLSVAVGINGELVWSEGLGFANIDERVPVTPATTFRIGTAATLLTSAGVGLLVEQGLLDLDQDVRTYVPEFPAKRWPVTVRQLMSHTAGIRNDAADEEPLSPHCSDPVDGIARFADRPLLFEPGTQYRYSSYGWRLVSAAVESAAREPFFSFMRRKVFDPLGLDDTRGDTDPEEAAGQAATYFPRFAADPRYGPQGRIAEDFSCFSGSTAYVSTASDLARFVMALESGALLEPATVAMLQAPQPLPSGADTGYGLGWDLETVELAGARRRLVVHDGILRGGMVSSVLSFPDRGLVVAVLSNTPFADTAAMALGLANIFAAPDAGQERR